MAENHDARFKALLRIETILRDFFTLFLPDTAGYVDFSRLEFVDKERMTLEGRRRTGDLLIKTRYRDHRAAFLIHLEHQARPDSLLAQRMLEYFALDWKDFKLPVYPVLVLSHAGGVRGLRTPVTVDFPDRRVLHFDFPVINLRVLDARKHAVLRNTAGMALSSAMRVAQADRIPLGVDMVCSLDNAPLESSVRDAVAGFFFSNHRMSDGETLKFHEELAKIRPQSRRKRIMQWTNPWIEKGIEQGIERGIERGIEQGIEQGIERGIEQGIELGMKEGRRQEAAGLVLRLLRRRCGSLPAEVEAAVQSMTLRRLESLGEALLDFTCAADLAVWLRRHSRSSVSSGKGKTPA